MLNSTKLFSLLEMLTAGQLVNQLGDDALSHQTLGNCDPYVFKLSFQK